MKWIYDDGGRADAGYRGETRDCVTRSIAIAAQLPYQEVYDALNLLAKREKVHGARKRSNARTGVHRKTYERYLIELGWTWTPTRQVGEGTLVHLREDELPSGRLVVRLTRHVTCVIDGVIHDTHDPSREGVRAVYGYYHLGDRS